VSVHLGMGALLTAATGRLAGVGETEAVRAERGVVLLDPLADLVGHLAHPVGHGQDRAACALQRLGDIRSALLAAEQAEFEGIAELSLRRAALARALGEIPLAEGEQP